MSARDCDSFETVPVPADGRSVWAGMRSVKFISPDRQHVIEACYEYEAPHGDSIHRLVIDGIPFPGFAWGCNFAWDPGSLYFVCSWMATWIDRRTVVIDLCGRAFFMLPTYFYDFEVKYPAIKEVRTPGVVGSEGERAFVFEGNEPWEAYGRPVDMDRSDG